MEFALYRSRHNPDHYVAIDAAGAQRVALEIRHSPNLEPFATFPDDGIAHLGFEPEDAKASIAGHGFYAFALTVTPRDHHGG